MSYHDKIQEKARQIAEDRQKVYTEKSDNFVWNKRQQSFINLIEGKIVRLDIMIKNKEKAIDEIVDIYNLAALLFEDLTK
jgi:hypothetical protein